MRNPAYENAAEGRVPIKNILLCLSTTYYTVDPLPGQLRVFGVRHSIVTIDKWNVPQELSCQFAPICEPEAEPEEAMIAVRSI
jgi:hypothetical protein